MTDWVEGVGREEMIQPEDIAEAVRFLLRTSRRVHRAGDPVHPARRPRPLSARPAPLARLRRVALGGSGRASARSYSSRRRKGAARPSPGGRAARAARSRSPVSARHARRALARRGRSGTSSRAMLASSIARRVLSSRLGGRRERARGRRCSGPRRGRSSPGRCGPPLRWAASIGQTPPRAIGVGADDDVVGLDPARASPGGCAAACSRWRVRSSRAGRRRLISGSPRRAPIGCPSRRVRRVGHSRYLHSGERRVACDWV